MRFWANASSVTIYRRWFSVVRSAHAHSSARSCYYRHGVLTCLYEVLLHADGEEAVAYAQAAFVAANLIDKSAEELDSVRIGPLLDALAPASDRVEEPRVLDVT